jgi:hypothetical protein
MPEPTHVSYAFPKVIQIENGFLIEDYDIRVDEMRRIFVRSPDELDAFMLDKWEKFRPSLRRWAERNMDGKAHVDA